MPRILTALAAVAALVALSLCHRGAAPEPSRRDAAPASGDAATRVAAVDEALERPAPPRREIGDGVADAATPAAVSPAALTVRVRFADADEPVSGAVVLLAPGPDVSPRLDGPRCATDEHGVARFTDVPRRLRCAVVSRFAWAPFDAVPGESAEVTVRVDRHGQVRGRVVDEAGVPIADAEVVAVQDYLYESAQVLAVSDRDGRFAARLRAVNTLLFARQRGRGTSAAVEHLSYGGEDLEVELVLGAGARSVRGVVTDGAGRPCAGAEIYLKHPSPVRASPALPDQVVRWVHGFTAADGRFVLDDVLPGPIGFVVRADGFAVTFVDLELPVEGAIDVAIELDPGIALSGQVVAADGAPVAGAVVTASTWAPWSELGATTGEDGTYTIRGLGPGKVALTARHHDLGFATDERELADGVARTTWSPTLARGGLLAGRVVDARGRPLAGLPVHALAPAHAPVWPETALTDRGGRFRLVTTSAAAHRIEVHSDGSLRRATLASVDGVVPGGDDLEIAVADDAMPTAFVTGRFVRPSGYELEPVRVLIHDDRSRWSTVFAAAADGTFRFGPLSAGTYAAGTMGLRSKLGGTSLGTFTLAPQQAHDLGTIVLPAPGDGSADAERR